MKTLVPNCADSFQACLRWICHFFSSTTSVDWRVHAWQAHRFFISPERQEVSTITPVTQRRAVSWQQPAPAWWTGGQGRPHTPTHMNVPIDHLLICLSRRLMTTHSLVTACLLTFQIMGVISRAADVRRIQICSAFIHRCRPGLLFSCWMNVICESARPNTGFWTESRQLALSRNAAVSVPLERLARTQPQSCLPLTGTKSGSV